MYKGIYMASNDYCVLMYIFNWLITELGVILMKFQILVYNIYWVALKGTSNFLF